MIDGHIHIEKGDYTLDWIQQFVDRAVKMELDERRISMSRGVKVPS